MLLHSSDQLWLTHDPDVITAVSGKGLQQQN